ncbi:MAG: ABC transporter substrate-binding protein [Rhizobiaceae bacterium]|nr:ABC transporter substrate-binding protein [Rhizobiaceae bacterium]
MNRLLSLFAATLFLGAIGTAMSARADDRVWHTSTSLIGESKYAGGFTHYEHVNPDAPKGGTFNSMANGAFDSFNPFIVQGTPAAGLNYQGGLLWDLMMSKAIDEPSASHPLIAEAFTYPEDYSSATYRLDKRARWHDGKRITPEDVKWSMETLKEHSPQYNRYFGDVKEIIIDSDTELTFVFAQKNNRELPLIIGDLPVLPKHWWEGTNEKGEKRDFTKTTLEAPLGSGPYKIGEFSAGSDITYERVKDYWAKDTPTRKGRFNFDKRRYTYFKDSNSIWEAFKKGGFGDIRVENRAEYWARRYNFPAFEAGDVKKIEIPDSSGYPMQGWVLNTRREQFQDPRVRKALTWAMNFEQMNKNLFFEQYTRTKSYFGGTELQATGLPEGRELEILTEYKGRIPDEIFTEEFGLPVYESRRDERKFLKVAFDLLQEAGWKSQGSKLVNAKGEQFKLELLGYSPASEKTNAPWLKALQRLGIDATFRIVDTSQYVARIGAFDYDVASLVTMQSQSPGNEQREYWSSGAADQDGSRNYMGAKDPVLDELVERVIYAKDRAELVSLTNALDRVLLFGYYTVPQWYLNKDRVAFWDKFGRPPTQTYRGLDAESWWIDPQKEAALNAKLK